MIEVEGIKMLTEAQWAQKHRAILSRQRDKGKVCSWYIGRRKNATAVFYREDQTRPYNKKEMEKARRKARELVRTRKERLSCKLCGKYMGRYAKFALVNGYCEFCRKSHTAWQWLEYARCIPSKDAEPYAHEPEIWDPHGEEWVSTGRSWYYYRPEQVRHASDAQYERYKAKYITLYGGWEKIDLEHTSYNGKKWW